MSKATDAVDEAIAGIINSADGKVPPDQLSSLALIAILNELKAIREQHEAIAQSDFYKKVARELADIRYAITTMSRLR